MILRHNKGFSLIELMCVLAALLILFSYSWSGHHIISRVTTHAQVTHLIQVCRYLQRSAMAENRKYILQFEPTLNQYQYEGTVVQLPPSLHFAAPPNAKGPPAHPKQIIQHPITFNNNQIVFHPDGIISTGTVYIADIKAEHAYAITCAVAHLSYIRTYRYTRSKWHLI